MGTAKPLGGQDKAGSRPGGASPVRKSPAPRSSKKSTAGKTDPSFLFDEPDEETDDDEALRGTDCSKMRALFQRGKVIIQTGFSREREQTRPSSNLLP